MTNVMPPELLERLGPEPCADTDPQSPEDHDELGWGRPITPARGGADDGERSREEEVRGGR